MLTYEGGRLFAGRSSFALPGRCKINDAPLATLRNGINLCSLDETCVIDANFEYGEGRAQTSLESNLAVNDIQGARMKSRSFQGGTGWCAEYKGISYSYLEVRFDAPTGVIDKDGREANIFRVVVTAPIDANMRSIRHSPEVAELLNSFQP